MLTELLLAGGAAVVAYTIAKRAKVKKSPWDTALPKVPGYTYPTTPVPAAPEPPVAEEIPSTPTGDSTAALVAAAKQRALAEKQALAEQARARVEQERLRKKRVLAEQERLRKLREAKQRESQDYLEHKADETRPVYEQKQHLLGQQRGNCILAGAWHPSRAAGADDCLPGSLAQAGLVLFRDWCQTHDGIPFKVQPTQKGQGPMSCKDKAGVSRFFKVGAKYYAVRGSGAPKVAVKTSRPRVDALRQTPEEIQRAALYRSDNLQNASTAGARIPGTAKF